MEVIRYLVFGVFVYAGAAALGSWAVTTRRISPFGRTAQLVRKTTDPVLVPLERWLLRRGGNPQNAPWWLLGLAIGGGIVVITLAEWLIRLTAGIAGSVQSGPRATIRTIVLLAGQAISLALIVRVIGSWFGATRWTRWMRPFYVLTDWLVNPIKRVLPPVGMFDLSPLVAWLLLQWLILPVVLSIL